jgi:hypothetical protein
LFVVRTLAAAQVLDGTERAVIAAALTGTRVIPDSSWILVADHTTTFQCVASSQEIINVGGCSGMRVQSQTADDILSRVHRAIPAIPTSVLADLKARSDTSVPISGALPLPVRQVIWESGGGAPVPSDHGTPALALAVSRVGFDSGRTKAVLYLGAMSWTDPQESYGEYVYLVKAHDTWSVAGRMRTWQLTP